MLESHHSPSRQSNDFFAFLTLLRILMSTASKFFLVSKSKSILAQEIQGCQDTIIIVFQYSCKLKAGFRENKLFSHNETRRLKEGYKLKLF